MAHLQSGHEIPSKTLSGWPDILLLLTLSMTSLCLAGCGTESDDGNVDGAKGMLNGSLHLIHDATVGVHYAKGTLCNAVKTAVRDGESPDSALKDGLGKAVVQVSKAVFGLAQGASPAIVSIGYQMLTWSTKMAVTRWIVPDLCDDHKDLGADSVAQRASRVLSDIVDSDKEGTIFTSTVTKEMKRKKGCTSYPVKKAEWCHRLGHSHQVPVALNDPNFAELREMNVKLTWSKMQNENTIKQLIDESDVCKWSVQDALCLDAFPPCDRTDLTPCSLACRNVKGCFHELFSEAKDSEDDSDARLSKYVRECEDMCSASVGMDVLFNPGKVIEAFTEDFRGIDAWKVDAARLNPVFPVLGGLGVFAAVAVAVCRRQRQQRSATVTNAEADAMLPVAESTEANDAPEF